MSEEFDIMKDLVRGLKPEERLKALDEISGSDKEDFDAYPEKRAVIDIVNSVLEQTGADEDAIFKLITKRLMPHRLDVNFADEEFCITLQISETSNVHVLTGDL